jgi:hypothetical protein
LADEVEHVPVTDASPYDRPAERLILELKVLRYTAPKGSFSGDSPVWKSVEGIVTDAATTLRLSDNGFRAAIGRDSDRKPLSNVLADIPDILVGKDDISPDTAHVVELVIGPCPARKAVFYYDEVGKLHGLEFVDAKSIFRMNLELRSTHLRDVWMRVLPRIEEPPGPAKWVITPEGARQIPQERVRDFTHLAFETTIREGGFLMLGPTDALYRTPLVGGAFFSTQASNPAPGTSPVRESLYIISPIVRSVAARVSRTEAASQ